MINNGMNFYKKQNQDGLLLFDIKKYVENSGQKSIYCQTNFLCIENILIQILNVINSGINYMISFNGTF